MRPGVFKRELAVAVSAVALACLGPPGVAAEPADKALAVGWHVPWAVGGPRLDSDGKRFEQPGEWPDFTVGSVRLWDTRTAWLHLQPRADAYRFDHLDAHLQVAEARGVEHITLVLAGTPRWAATREAATDAAWLGPGSASPPRDTETWSQFVRAVSERYRGRIDAYEIGNEPNLSMFWNGTYGQLGEHVSQAARVIRQVDPDAQVVAPAPLITGIHDVQHAHDLWSELSPESVDVLAFHFYPRSSRGLRQLGPVIEALSTFAAALGFHQRPLWITEANPGSVAGPTQLRRLERIAEKHGVPRLHWYAWMQRESPDLLEFH